MTKEQVLGVIRHGLTFIGGFLVTKGLLDDGMLQEALGAIMTLVGAVWSVTSKKAVAPENPAE
jgi:hypothetical protein